MTFDLGDVALLLLFLSGAYWWWRGYAVKEVALQSARAHCRSFDVQLLDESVVMRGLWFKRDSGGHLHVRRSFTFEFTSTGDERYHGSVVMLGAALETVQLEPHRLN